MTEKYLRSLIREMIRGEFNKAVPGQKGKRFIPDIIKVSKKEINTLKPMLLVLCSKGESIDKVKENGWGNTIKIVD